MSAIASTHSSQDRRPTAQPASAPSRKASWLRRLAFAASAALALGSADLAAQNQAFPGAAVRSAAGLSRVGPIDPVTRMPSWYQDRSGVRLKQCQNPATCLFAAPQPGAPSFPANWPNEWFYFSADTTAVGATTQRMLYAAALEMAYANGAIVIGEEVTFTRIRFRMNGLVPNATYRVTHPYGIEVQTADGLGIVAVTRDIMGAGGDFQTALAGDIGPFLLPAGSTLPLAPGSLIGDGTATTRVQGAPSGNNLVRIEGPGVGAAFPNNVNADPALGPDPVATDDCVDFLDFVLTGQVASVMGISIDKAAVTKNATRTSVDVWATSAGQQNVEVSVDNNAWIRMTEKGTSGQYFARLEFGMAATRPASVTVRNLTDIPTSSVTASIAAGGQQAVPDTVFVDRAVFTIGGSLQVSATTTEPASIPTLTAAIDGVPPVTMVPAGTDLSRRQGIVVVPQGVPPPRSVTVTSSQGGTATVPVIIEGSGFTGVATVPLFANAGPDATAASNQRVSLSGLASLGPVATWQWTHNAPTTFTIEGANTATPTLVVPDLGTTSLDVLVTLRVTDQFGTPATDTMIVHVVNPVVLDRLAVASAHFTRATSAWQISGTAALRQGQVVTLYLGTAGNTARRIGTAVVNATGTWTFIGGRNSAVANGTTPVAGDTTVWAVSALGGAPVAMPFRVQ